MREGGTAQAAVCGVAILLTSAGSPGFIVGKACAAPELISVFRDEVRFVTNCQALAHEFVKFIVGVAAGTGGIRHAGQLAREGVGEGLCGGAAIRVNDSRELTRCRVITECFGDTACVGLGSEAPEAIIGFGDGAAIRIGFAEFQPGGGVVGPGGGIAVAAPLRVGGDVSLLRTEGGEGGEPPSAS